MISLEDYLAESETLDKPEPKAIKDVGLATTFGPQEGHPQGHFDNTELVDDDSAGNAIAGTFAGIGVELGAGLGATAYLKYAALGRKVLALGRAGKLAAGAQAATGAGVGTGAVTFAVSEAAIWGASNFLGQKTRQAFGIQEDLSAAEMLAASLFGVGVVARQADKIFKLGDGVNDLKAWKDISGTLGNKRAFLSGASLGIAETALRQELEQLMNEDANRNAYEYLFAGVLGGGLNTVFNAWARGGSWGVEQMDTLSKRTLKTNQEAIDSVKNEMKGVKDPRQRRRMRKRLVELEKAHRNLQDFDDYVQKTKTAQEALDNRKTDNNEVSEEDLKAEQARRESEMPPPASKGAPKGEAYTKENVVGVKTNTIQKLVEVDRAAEGVGVSDVKSIEELGESLKKEGFKEPITITYDPATGKALITDGNTRLAAAIQAGIEDVPIVVNRQYNLFREGYEVAGARPPVKIAEPNTELGEGGLKYSTQGLKDILEPTPPPTEQPRIPEPEEPTPKTPEEPEVIRDKEEIVTDEEEGEFTFGKEQDDVLEAIKESEADIRVLGGKNFTTVAPNIGRRLKPRQERLTVDIDSKVKALVRKRQAGEDVTADDIAALKADVYLLRRMNDTLDLVETNGGRSLQGLSGDAAKYGKYITEYSSRSYAQRAALIRFQNTLDVLSSGKIKDMRNTIDALDEYVGIPEKFGLTGRFRFGKIEDVRAELDDMEWNDVKKMAKAYNDELPEGAERIKLSGKGVTRESIKDKVAALAQSQQNVTQVKARVNKTLQKLEKTLTEIRSRHFTTETSTPIDGPAPVDKYGKEIVDEANSTAVAEATRKAFEEDADVRRLRAQIKYYKDSIDDLDRIEKLEADLTELAEIEGRGVISEIEQKILKKYKISPPQVKTKVTELKTKIAESKKRMRDKINDVRKVEKERETAQIYQDYEDMLSAALDLAPTSKFLKVLQTGNTWRKMNLINQLPSILAGVPTAGYAVVREGVVRPFVTAVRQFTGTDKDSSLAFALAADEAMGFWTGFFSANGIKDAAKRAFKEGRDPTTGHLTRFADDFRTRTTLEGTIQRAKRKQVTEADSKQALDSLSGKVFNIANITNLFSVGIRGIGVLDAVTKRQMIQGTLIGQSRKQARLELHGKPGISEKQINDRAEEIYNAKWKDDDGLQVLDVLGDHEQFVDDIQESILLARQHMDPELIHKDFGDKIINMIKEASGSSEEAELLVGMFMPYISVPIKGAYIGLRLTAPVNFLQARYANPYERKIAKLEEGLNLYTQAKEKARLELGKENISENSRKVQEGIIKDADDALEKAKIKRATLERYAENYTQNAVMSDVVAFGLFSAGYAMALQGNMTGSLNWMTQDQREKAKLQPFMGMNMDYRAASPLAIPLAMGADLAHYLKARNEGVLKDTQNIPMMFASTMITLTQEVPLFTGMKSLQKLASGGPGTKASELSKILASYAPVPAQLRKTFQAVELAGGDRTIGDLRGASFTDRFLYGAIGKKPTNRKTNRFGEDIEGTHTVFTTTISRQLPRRAQEIDTKFERILSTDVYNQIGNPPESFIGQRMDKFIDDEGVTLRYAFMKKVETMRVSVDGKRKMTLKEAVEKLIGSRSWERLYDVEEYERTKSGQPYNEGLRQLNALLNKYYDAIELKLSRDKSFMKRFVGQDNETLDKTLKFEKDIPFVRKSLNLKFN